MPLLELAEAPALPPHAIQNIAPAPLKKLAPAARAPEAGRCQPFTVNVKVTRDSANSLSGSCRANWTAAGLALSKAGESDWQAPIPCQVEQGKNQLRIAHQGREVEFVVSQFGVYQERLALDMAACLRGGKPNHLRLADYKLPVYLYLLAAVPLGIPVLTLGGAIWGGLGAGLAALCYGIVQREKLPVSLRAGLALGLSAIGYVAMLLTLALARTPNEPQTARGKENAPEVKSVEKKNEPPERPEPVERPEPPERPKRPERPRPQPVDPDNDDNGMRPEAGKLVLKGRDGEVSSLAFTAKGDSLLCATRSKIVVYALPGGTEKNSFAGPQGRQLSSVALSPDGKIAAVGSLDGGMGLYDPATGDLLVGFPMSPRAALWAVAISQDGTTLASAHGTGEVILWDAKTGERKASLDNKAGQVLSLAFSPDKRTLAVGSQERVVKLWDWTANKSISVLAGHEEARVPWDGYRSWQWSIRALSYARDGKLLVSAGNDCTARIWAPPGQRAILPHNDVVTAAACSPRDDLVVTGCADGSVRAWALSDGKRRGSPLIERGPPIHVLTFSADGSKLAIGTAFGTIQVWDASLLTR